MNRPNGRFEFLYQYSEKDPKVTMVLSPDATLTEAIEAFETFLTAAGYHLDGPLEINGNFDPELYDPNAEKN